MIKRKKPRFLRKDTFKRSKLGRGRRKKQIWRRAIGRHNKIREKNKGYGRQPSIGYGNPNSIRGKINGLTPVMIYNENSLKEVKNNEIAIIGKIGRKNKIKIAETALAKNIKIANFDIKKFLEEIKKEREEKLKKKDEKNKEKTAEEEKHDDKKENGAKNSEEKEK